ncbi:MAG TPA: 23S rRNA (pseudouridine(1915)-N(3))-methyltransferase RlmH [Flavobacteriaceae bacterium]|nr:23S rRNA (pseudouridine(1915)-N(3))-methyltransferase RlmH [Flavobacteriaceae bacterium]
MKITLLVIGKTDKKELQSLIQDYEERLRYYISFEISVIPDLRKTKHLTEELQKKLEGEEILKRISPSDEVILLDERGKAFTSVDFSDYIQKKMNSGLRNLMFVIGGPYGFSEDLYTRANGRISLSDMTFSHQMIRLFFVEQVYRAFTILRNEPYHHR